MNQAHQVTTLLKALGETAQAVGQSLTNQQCHGRRGSCSECPVAVYLHRALAAPDTRIGVNPDKVWVCTPLGLYRITVPTGVRNFITAFDAGSYPNLVARERDE
jgi:hypothetical protein